MESGLALVLVTPTAAPVSMDPADWGLSLGAAAATILFVSPATGLLGVPGRTTPHWLGWGGHTALLLLLFLL